MKASVLLVLLLGFGLTGPLTCTKAKDKKSSEKESIEKRSTNGSKKMVLGGTSATIKLAKQGRG